MRGCCVKLLFMSTFQSVCVVGIVMEGMGRECGHQWWGSGVNEENIMAPAPVCYCWWGTNGGKGAHGERRSASL